jgi:Mn-dependent DtxR family transcriptional regulator
MMNMIVKRTLKEDVFRSLFEHPDYGPTEMAALLKANYGSVKDAYNKLCSEGLLKRECRGYYSLNIPGILLDIYNRLERLERGAGYE